MSRFAGSALGRLLPRSISARLTLALSALAVAVFASVAVLLHHALEEEVDRARAQDLAGKIDIVHHLLEEVQQPQDFAALRHHLDDLSIGDGQMRVWLLDADGGVLYGGRLRPQVSEGSAGHVRVLREDGLVMDGRRIALPPHPVLGTRELIVAIDTRVQQALLQRYRTRIATVCGLGVALTVLLAAGIAWSSLRPVQRLSREAAALNPQALSVRLSAVDAAELQTLVQSFNRALDRVEAAYGQLEGFSADVAHELRTPLATMIHATEVALHRERSAAELRETLQLNLEILREQSVLVNDMLFLAKADRGQAADSLRSTDLRAEAQHVAEYFEPLLEDKGLRLEILGAAAASCNPTLMRRALVNLVGNATRYTDAQGTIAIVLGAHGGWVRVAVRNPGSPIPAELMPRLFERFFRADSAREHSGSHHGLGLAIVRAIAVMHAGRTFAQCAGGWTEIGLELPVSTALAGTGQFV